MSHKENLFFGSLCNLWFLQLLQKERKKQSGKRRTKLGNLGRLALTTERIQIVPRQNFAQPSVFKILLASHGEYCRPFTGTIEKFSSKLQPLGYQELRALNVRKQQEMLEIHQ